MQMNAVIHRTRRKTLARAASLSLAASALTLLTFWSASSAAPQSSNSLAQQIYDTMVKIAGASTTRRPVHAKGIVCKGTFTSTAAAAGLSSAAHLQGKTVPVTIRLSDGAPDPAIPDFSPNAFPRGIAIRFQLPGGGRTDIVAISHNGFVVGTGEEFLALEQSVAATDPSKPHPWPVEQFLGAHPRALKFVQDQNPVPESFATAAFFSNNAFVLVNKQGAKQPVRYQIVPVAGVHYLSDAGAKAKTPDFLFDELKARLGKAPVKFRLLAQLPNLGESTSDSSIVWPADRKTVNLGTVTITSVDPNSDADQKTLAFTPTALTSGIELSDDPLPALRGRVYAISVMHRLPH
jgi:catalase